MVPRALARRRFVAALAAASASALLGADAPSAAPSAQTTPLPVVTVGWTREPNFDPPTFTSAADHELGRLLYEPLFDVDIFGRLVPRLAEAVPTKANGGISSDGLTVRYRIRPDATFSDGGPVTAADVLATLDEETRAGAPVADVIGSIHAQDARTVVVRLKRRSASFIDRFFVGTGIVSAVFERGTRDASRPGVVVGSGPFRLASYNRGDAADFVPNEHYYGVRPQISVRVKILPDANTLRTTLETHEVDVAVDLAPGAATATMLARRDLHSVSATLPGAVMIAVATWKPPFDSATVRRAFNLAVDRETIAKKVLVGEVTPATAYVTPGRWLDAPPVNTLRSQDAESARLLESSGWHLRPDGYRYRGDTRLAATLTLQPAFEPIGIVLQAMFRAIGADVALRSFPANLYFAPADQGGIVRGGKFDLALVADYSTTDPDVSGHLGCTAGKPGVANVSRFCDPALDAAILHLDELYDGKLRRDAYAHLARMIDGDSPIIYLYHPVELAAARSELLGVTVDSLGIFGSAAAWRLRR